MLSRDRGVGKGGWVLGDLSPLHFKLMLLCVEAVTAKGRPKFIKGLSRESTCKWFHIIMVQYHKSVCGELCIQAYKKQQLDMVGKPENEAMRE